MCNYEKNKLFNVLKIFIDFSLNTDTIITIQLKNLFKENYIINIDDNNIAISSNEIINIKITNYNSLVKIILNEETIYCEKIKIKKYLPSGFGENSLVETLKGPVKIKELNSGDVIYDKYTKPMNIDNVYIFTINNNDNNKPVIINKSKCGIYIPYQNLELSLKNILKIKNIILKGRNLFLSKKAKYVNFNDTYKYYSIETENSKEYLINGFIVDPLQNIR